MSIIENNQTPPNGLIQGFEDYFNLLISPEQVPIDTNAQLPIKQQSNPSKRQTKKRQLSCTIQDNTEDDSQEVPKRKPKKKRKSGQRKRVNYCFEIHRSGCPLKEDSRLYCKVFLKGKLKSEVDLIKGARGKWAYTFYDERKDKNERRYWPSQSSGPIIQDPCSCLLCNKLNLHESDSSPFTEDPLALAPLDSDYHYQSSTSSVIDNSASTNENSASINENSDDESNIFPYPLYHGASVEHFQTLNYQIRSSNDSPMQSTTYCFDHMHKPVLRSSNDQCRSWPDNFGAFPSINEGLFLEYNEFL